MGSSTKPAPVQRRIKEPSAKLAAALRYAALEWAVLPIYGFRDGRCACGNDCEKPGKHPRTRRGVKDAASDPRKIRAWWGEWPNANVAIATGRISGLLVMDVDLSTGGYESLKELLGGKERPRTPTVKTGGGGLHLYFELSSRAGAKNRVSILPGLDIRADGGFVVAPPSSHVSGQRYEWLPGLAPWEVELTPVPSWLTKLLSENRRRKSAATRESGKPIREGRRNESLVRIAGKLRRMGAAPEEIEAFLLSVNENRCDPPLPEAEVQAIVRSAENWEPGTGSSPYFVTPEGIFFEKVIRDEVVPVKLTNFDARIVTDIVEDDGLEIKRHCEIEAKLFGRTKSFVVPAATFTTMSWPLEVLGAKAVVSPGMGLRDHARAAIQVLSAELAKERQVFIHSGWRRYRGKYVYLHRDGAIGESGSIANIEVKLPSSLDNLNFPAPPDGEGLRRAVRASLDFLKIGPPSVTYSLHAGVSRAPLGPCDFSEHLAGETAWGKPWWRPCASNTTGLVLVNAIYRGPGVARRTRTRACLSRQKTCSLCWMILPQPVLVVTWRATTKMQTEYFVPRAIRPDVNE
jgi:hypothetical protein